MVHILVFSDCVNIVTVMDPSAWGGKELRRKAFLLPCTTGTGAAVGLEACGVRRVNVCMDCPAHR